MTGPKTRDGREKRNSSGTAAFAGDLGRYLFSYHVGGQRAPNAPPFPTHASVGEGSMQESILTLARELRGPVERLWRW